MAVDEHGELIVRLTETLRADERVRAAWLSGSHGRGTADRFSDVDVLAVVGSGDLDPFTTACPALLAEVADLVLVRRHGFGTTQIFTAVTPAWLRFDLAVTTLDGLATRAAEGLISLFDRDGVQAALRTEAAEESPSATAVSNLIEEFFRVLGLLPVVVGRGEDFAGAAGAGLLRAMTMQMVLMDAATTSAGGALNLRRRLPPDAMRALDGLPGIVAERESVVAAHVGCAEVFLPAARRVAERAGVEWPGALEAACRGYLRRELEVEFGG